MGRGWMQWLLRRIDYQVLDGISFALAGVVGRLGGGVSTASRSSRATSPPCHLDLLSFDCLVLLTAPPFAGRISSSAMEGQSLLDKLDAILQAHVANGDDTTNKLLGASFAVVNKEGETDLDEIFCV